ncbi:MAG: hypothetical protein WCK27_27360, partial [Verrucomicrobiota bacterium]
LPVDQTADGMTAHFRAAVGAYSVQTASSLGGLRLPLFSGHFPVPANHTGSIMDIQFSELVTNVTFVFATLQVQPIEKETPIRLTAYTNSTTTPAVGVTNATGVYGANTWPMGTLTFRSSTPFNLVRISVPTITPTPPTGQAYDFCLDNLTVQRAGGLACTITASPSLADGGLITGGGGYSAGLTATLTAEANLGYGFVSWTEGDTVVSTSASFSFVVSADRTLVANFTPIYTITTSSSPVAGGTTSGGGSYGSGTNVTVVATTNAGYAFVNWTEGGSAVTNAASYTFAATADRALVSNFVRVYAISTSASPGAGGSTSGDGSYPVGSNVTVVATANLGYAFVNWTQGGSAITNAASYSFIVGAANRALVANFTPVFTITTSALPVEGGLTSGDGIYPSGSNVTVVAAANLGYAFVNWSEGGSAVTNAANYSFVVGAANRALVANFTPVFTITTSALPVEGGLTSGDGIYPSGSNVTVVAAANLGYAFVNWSEGGSAVTNAASYSFVVGAANRALVANFTPVFTITTSSSPVTGGTTSGGGSYGSGTNVTVVATANTGYAFVNWSEGGSTVTNAASYTFVATADRALVANFAPLLSIALTPPDALVLSWTASANGYALWQNSSLDPGTWGLVTNPVSVVGVRKVVSISPLTGPGFYRLFHP